MTNTKFRKRALLSSVAMLLVALVALGSATFAWFVDDPTADAKGLNASAQSATGLQIKTDSTPTWSHHAKIAYADANTAAANIALAPAMYNKNDGKFYSVKAASAGASGALSTDKWASVAEVTHAGNNTGVYHESITLRKTGSATAAEHVYVSGLDLGVSTSMAEAVVVMLTDGTTIWRFTKTARSSTSAIPVWNVAITTAGDGTVYTANTDTAESMAPGAYAKADAVDLGTFAAGTNVEKALDLYVYLDGDHSTVYSDNAVNVANLVSKCNFYFALDNNYAKPTMS